VQAAHPSSRRLAAATVLALLALPALPALGGAGAPFALEGGLAPFAVQEALGLRPALREPLAADGNLPPLPSSRTVLGLLKNEGLPAGLPLWTARYDGPAENWDIPHGIAVDPLGRRVYVTGESVGQGTWQKYATLAYDAATGAPLWEQRYSGTTTYSDVPAGAAASADLVVVTGFAQYSGVGADYATIAYDGLTGERRWVARYDGGSSDFASAVAFSPDGSKVFVTGYSARGGAWTFAYATAAYDAATGAQLWASRYEGPGNDDYGLDLAVSGDGSTVVVTGISHGGTGKGYDMATLAYDAATGATRWVARSGTPWDDKGRAVALTPDGTGVLVAGEAGTPGNRPVFGVAAYDLATGAERWFTALPGGTNHYDVAEGVGASPDGARAYVGGWRLTGVNMDYGVAALDAATGAVVWDARYDGAGDDDYAWDLAVGPGDRVYLTGQSWGPTAYDMTTAAWDGATGQRVWVHRVDGPVSGRDYGNVLAVDPLGVRVFVAGYSRGLGDSLDYLTAAHLVDPVAAAHGAMGALSAP
jgi:outer membrane protein assembly factor BamB